MIYLQKNCNNASDQSESSAYIMINDNLFLMFYIRHISKKSFNTI